MPFILHHPVLFWGGLIAFAVIAVALGIYDGLHHPVSGSDDSPKGGEEDEALEHGEIEGG